MPGHTRTGRRRPRGHPLASEVVDRSEEVIVSGLLELSGVRAHLLPRRAGGEVAPYGVSRSGRPAKHLGHGLVGDPLARLGAGARGRLTAATIVGGGQEGLHEHPARSSAPASLFSVPAPTLARRLGEDPLGMP